MSTWSRSTPGTMATPTCCASASMARPGCDRSSWRPAAVLRGRDAVPCPEDTAEMRGAAESPAGSDVRDTQVAYARIGEIVAAPAQPLLADPVTEGEAVESEEPVKLTY